MPYTFLRVQPFNEVVGADAEKLFGVGAAIAERIRNNVHAAGTIFVPGSIVPAGTIWVVTTAAAWNSTAASSRIAVELMRGGVSYSVAQIIVCNAFVTAFCIGQIIMIAGDQLRAVFDGVALNDDLYLAYTGHSMVAP